MAINIPRGQSDESINEIIGVLREYEADHPQTEIDLYRQNSVSLRIRIIDPAFAGQGKPQRSQQAWRYLEKLPEDVQSDISTVLLLTLMRRKTRLQTSSLTIRSPRNFSLLGALRMVCQGTFEPRPDT